MRASELVQRARSVVRQAHRFAVQGEEIAVYYRTGRVIAVPVESRRDVLKALRYDPTAHHVGTYGPEASVWQVHQAICTVARRYG